MKPQRCSINNHIFRFHIQVSVQCIELLSVLYLPTAHRCTSEVEIQFSGLTDDKNTFASHSRLSDFSLRQAKSPKGSGHTSSTTFKKPHGKSSILHQGTTLMGQDYEIQAMAPRTGLSEISETCSSFNVMQQTLSSRRKRI